MPRFNVAGPLFTNVRFHDNGLELQFKDRGWALVTGGSEGIATFNVTSLRNIALTGPSMHDGGFTSLEELAEHYSSGIQPSATQDPDIAEQPNPAGVNFMTTKKAALVAVLKTLSDSDHANKAIK